MRREDSEARIVPDLQGRRRWLLLPLREILLRPLQLPIHRPGGTRRTGEKAQGYASPSLVREGVSGGRPDAPSTEAAAMRPPA